MKTFLIAMGLITACGCSIEKDIQVEMVRAELISIDTIFRHPETLQLLTWRDMNKVRYISYEPLNRSYIVGTSMLVMVHR